MKSIGLHHNAKTAIQLTKATQITISYKHTMLIYKEKYKFNVTQQSENGLYEPTVVRTQQ